MKPIKYVTIGLIFAATTALAHQNVQNPAVKARMDAMGAIAENTKTLGAMAKGAVEFDAAQARRAAAAIAEHAAKTPELFRVQENDPKSEALPQIWQTFDDFTAKSVALKTLAAQLSTSLSEHADLQPALMALGAQCKACHGTYRQ